MLITLQKKKHPDKLPLLRKTCSPPISYLPFYNRGVWPWALVVNGCMSSCLTCLRGLAVRACRRPWTCPPAPTLVH